MSRLVVTVLAACALAACERPAPPAAADLAPPPPAAPATPLEAAIQRAQALEAAAGGFVKQDASWAKGEATATYAVLRAGRVPRLIEEKLSLGEEGASLNLYFFDEQGRLFYFRENGVRTETRDVGYRLTVEKKLEVAIAFDSTGTVVGARYAVDGREEPLPDTRAAEAKARAVLLLDHASAPAR